MSPSEWFELVLSIARVVGYFTSLVLTVMATRAWYKDDKQTATLYAVWAVLLGGGQ